MNKDVLNNLVIRTGIVRDMNNGYIIACDTSLEENDIPHARVFKWSFKTLRGGNLNFDAHSCCLVTKPVFALVMLSHTGDYGISTEKLPFSGDIFEDTQPASKRSGYVGFRSVSEIAGRAYAVGLRGMVYKLDDIKKWSCIDEGLPDTFDIQAIHGFSSSDVYAVGWQGEVWKFDGRTWIKCELPTNANLTAVKCAPDGLVYISGQEGVVVYGREDSWSFIEHGETTNDIWDVEWFYGSLYLSTISKVYELQENRLVLVDFGRDVPGTCYQLSVATDVMWSVGEKDIMSFDGDKWSRVI